MLYACSFRCSSEWHVYVTACLSESLWEQKSFHHWRLCHAGMRPSWWFQNYDTLKGHFLFSFVQPCCMTFFSVWNCRSFSVWALISSSFESLTGRRLVSWSENDFLDNVSATGMPLPGRCTMMKLYRIIFCSLGGTNAKGFHIDSRGLWSLSTMTWRP